MAPGPWVKDLSASLDYLESPGDINTENVGYFGWSLGGRMGPIPLVVEPRIDAAVFNVGGLNQARFYPESDPFNFVPRVTTPVLMINGEYDIVFPYATSQVPMFELLGTPDADKKHHVFPSGHLVPFDEVIRETLAWFDKYLGVPVGKGE